jgi:ankyrin repeat protein
MEASALGHKEAAKILLERGADTSRRSPDGETAASLAQKNYRTEIQALLANTPSRPTPKVVFTDK